MRFCKQVVPVRLRGSESVSKCHGFTTLIDTDPYPDPNLRALDADTDPLSLLIS